MTTVTVMPIENERKPVAASELVSAEGAGGEAPVSVLLVDDEVKNLDVLESILQSENYRLVRADTPDDALMALLTGEFAVIVLDIQMPVMSGIELANLIKQRKRTQNIPIIFLTAYFHGENDVLAGYNVGAVDYLTKPVDPRVLKSKVAVFVDLFRKTRSLAQANARLEREINQRCLAEDALRVANIELEERVQTRTADLIQANKILRESEDRFRTLTSNAPVGIFMCDVEGRSVYVNQSWRSLAGLELEDALGFGWLKAVHPDDRERISAGWSEAVSRGEPSNAEFRFLRLDGTITWVQGNALQLLGVDGSVIGYIGTVVNITDRKLAADALAEARNRLEDRVLERTLELREKNDQLEEYIYSIAHDLRGPLRAMEACSHLLLHECFSTLNPAGQEYARRINDSASFMDRLLLDLLEYGRSGHSRLDLTLVDVESAWRMAIFQCQHQIQERNALVEIVSALPKVRAHEGTLAQALVNLLSNALRFVEKDRRPHVRIFAERQQALVRLWIEDNGIGIALKHQERIFRVFERLHGARYGGTGIGLAIVRKGIERMGGRVGVESDLGKGSKFWIELAGE